ncbi:TetR/AcrR family transcriptional regulator [Streptomyces sp. H10-C2]|uniref:TetR/AcrR family transcriptional regulator n=1 Tax=unclassified Streptomyces TaxID=2593676 RepID=UPI0024B9E93A|nr:MULTISPECIES: TetR/AcrR family transcriptional regulator [unclassified Streptomyces]MDJ0346255.1 TetR/AcrR family transcriptional regulator [Streptomyces sp. PH10-H1]MDJ0375258.1 TetR/AcrR family transcriptional regulator [Streptomyces sp. H10-C2]
MAKTSMRMSAEDRRESVTRAAMTEFARGGYFGTSTDAIARRVGVSQPYLFRLFPTKVALFKAAANRCFDRTVATFEQAAEGLHGEEALSAMGEAYGVMIEEDRDLLLMQMQLYVAAAASGDGEVAELVRSRWLGMWDMVRSRTGVDDEELNKFFSTGMLINTLVSLGIPSDDRCWMGFSFEEPTTESP